MAKQVQTRDTVRDQTTFKQVSTQKKSEKQVMVI